MSTNKNTNKKLIDKLESIAGERLTLGSLMRSIRLGEELTQDDFSSLLGLSRQNLCDIEKGRRIISPKMAATFSKKLGYSQDQFIRLCLQDLLERDGFQ